MRDDERGNGRDLSIELAQLRRQLARLSPRDRLNALVTGPDAEAVVRSMPPEDLYSTIADVGLADSTEIVQLAAPAQFRAFVDLGAWSKDRIDVHRAIIWLRAARGDETQEFLAKVHALDLELLEFVLRSATIIHDLELNPDVHPRGVILETPEGKYLIEFKVEGPELSAMRELISDLFAEDPFEASRLIETIRWELPSELEEGAYQFRRGRLADLGFPPLEQATSIFTFVEPGLPQFEPNRQELAGPRVDYLDAAFRDVMDAEREELKEQLRYLANAALVAEAAEPGDPAAARSIAEMARDYLALGFDHLSGGDPLRASAVLGEMKLQRVFQVGFSLTLKLKFRADRLAKRPLALVDDAYLLFPEEESVVMALRRRRPMRALRVEGAEPVVFRSGAELRDAEDALARAEQQVSFLGALLGGTLEPARESLARFGIPLRELGVDRLFAAIAANSVLDGAVRIAPVERARLLELLESAIEGEASAPRVRASAVERSSSVLTPLVPKDARAELQRQLGQALSRLATELGPAYLSGSQIPPQSLAHLPTR